MKKFFDLTLSMQNAMLAWPGDTMFERQENRGTAIVSKLTMSSHTGTHVDAPRHFLFNKTGIDSIALSQLIGKCRVIEIKNHSPRRTKIKIEDIKFKISKGDKILFKTRNSKLLKRKTFTADYVSLGLDAAKYLARQKIDLVGIDYFGIEAKSAPGHPVHKTLLGAGIVVVEGLDLSKINPGLYNLAALPLKIRAGDGSPARVVAWK